MKRYFLIFVFVFVLGCGGSGPSSEKAVSSIQNKVLSWVGLKNTEKLPVGVDKNGYRTLVTIRPYDPCLDRHLCQERKQKKETEEDLKYSLPPLKK